MSRDEVRHYWIIFMDDYDIDWEQFTVRELRDTFMGGIKKNIKYTSVINKYGENMMTTEGHQTKALEDEEWIEVLDAEGNVDIEETANNVTKDFLDNRAIIAMRFEGDMYEELGKDKSWIDDILLED